MWKPGIYMLDGLMCIHSVYSVALPLTSTLHPPWLNTNPSLTLSTHSTTLHPPWLNTNPSLTLSTHSTTLHPPWLNNNPSHTLYTHSSSTLAKQ